MRAVSRISAAGEQRAPDTRPGEVSGEERGRVPGTLHGAHARAQSLPRPLGTDGPEPSASASVLGEAEAPTARVAGRPFHCTRGCFAAPVPFRDWFANLNSPTDCFSPSN